jgi:hypothetical protein
MNVSSFKKKRINGLLGIRASRLRLRATHRVRVKVQVGASPAKIAKKTGFRFPKTLLEHQHATDLKKFV